MVDELAERGSGSRESGAFLLSRSRSDGRTVHRVVFYDDLDPDCLVGGIHLSGKAYPPLWDLCDREQLRVVGDLHTHPGSWVAQSNIDAENPMLARAGHIALILPKYANGNIARAEVGVHVYRGADGWESFLGHDAERRLYVGWWP